MKSLLVKIASVAVMFHMTFGCSMHHGFGNTACAHQHETTCSHDSDAHEHSHDDSCHDHEHHDHEHHESSDSERPTNFATHQDAPCHAGCSDDGCHVTQITEFKFQSFEFSVPYFGSVHVLALIEGQSCRGFDVDPFPDPIRGRANMRAHLQFGVQIV